MTRTFIAFLALLLPAGAAAPATTNDLLARAGKSSDDFWRQMQAVNCVETVEQSKLSRQGKVVYKQQSVFDYLVMIQFTPDDLLLDESRAAIQQPAPSAKKKKADGAEGGKVALVVTNGFPAFELIFHPLFQHSFEYSQPEQVLVDGKPQLLVRFRHIHGARSPSVMKVRSREYPVEWQGTAWLDPETCAITRITATVANAMSDAGLTGLTADVRYLPVQFREDPQAHLLPASATVELETTHQHWRNTHTFANYRRFSVDVKTEMGTPE